MGWTWGQAARVDPRVRVIGQVTICVALAVVPACASPGPVPEPPAGLHGSPVAAYLKDPGYRRAELERSLVSLTNGYARRRLAAYTESGWGALPEWNPAVAPASFAGRGNAIEYRALVMPSSANDVELLELGRRAFVTYPLQLADYMGPALARADAASRYGLYDDGGHAGGLVSAKLADGTVHLAVTCATCHARVEGGRLVLGKTNDALRIDLLVADASGAAPLPWGKGRVDVTGDDVTNPTAITDLRPVRFQTNIHRAGTLRNGLVPLAIRLETLAITSLGETSRPPREVAIGLALYVRTLGDALKLPERTSEGAHVFERVCARCHAGPDLTGPAVPFEEVDTDAAILLGPERTTGRARVPSLRGVADRTPLMSSGEIPNLEALLAPRSQRPGGGHTFGQELPDRERAVLLEWLKTLD